ncbi:restriction endonuclease subunit S [Cryobacterium melibiosiphilum]|uniref:Restriction endonuclease subunit S n=1 Tax=Cryobacterium melibiosiphilum TaxID=995039 RepID=A0A3A5MAW1_9MICO|nr:restriction endonuclease subunit S [Cryobacterium melibiosiphilum]RJT87247.1 restriction endonuclease subunit S [Cryobacterium melibiosiphilum]
MSWSTARLDQVAEIVGGSTPKTGVAEYWNGDIPWVTPADLSDLSGHYIGKTPRTVTPAGLSNSGSKLLAAGSVLLSSRAPIGHVAINTVPMATNQGFKSLVPDASKVDSKFLFWWLKANKLYLQSLGNGATFKEISKAIVARVVIPLPCLVEQRRIASILDHADTLRVKRRRALLLLDELATSIFVEMFGANSGHEMQDLSDVCSAHSGGTPSKARADYWEGGLPWFSPKDLKTLNLYDAIDHVNAVVLEETALRIIPKDTVAVVVRGMILSHSFPVSRLRVQSTINQDLKALLPKNGIDPAFLAHSLIAQAPIILSKVSTAGHGTKRLDTQSLMSTQVPKASMKSQLEFRARIDRLDSHRETLVKRADALDELFASLQHRAFQGEL